MVRFIHLDRAQGARMRRMIRLALAVTSLIFTFPLACSSPPASPPLAPCYFVVQVGTQTNSRLVVLDQNGEALVTLEDGSSPSFSHDGLLYYSAPLEVDNFSFFQIFRLNLMTQESGRISDGTTNCDRPACSWNDQIAFMSGLLHNPADPYWRLYLMDSQGNNPQVLDEKLEVQQFSPTWSPQGDKLAFVRRSTIEEINKDQKLLSTLKIYELGTKTSHSLLPEDYVVDFPSWSPQGDLIAFTLLESEHKNSIWVVRPDGTGIRRLTSDHDDNQASWMPDGKKLLFSRADGNRRVICQLDVESLQVTPFFEKQLNKFLGDKVEEAVLEYPRIHFLTTCSPEANQPTQDKK